MSTAIDVVVVGVVGAGLAYVVLLVLWESAYPWLRNYVHLREERHQRTMDEFWASGRPDDSDVHDQP